MKQTSSANASSSASSLLLVDDNADLRHSMAEMLSGAGWRVAQASTAEEALELASAQRFAVLVSDVSMPGMSGVELVRKLHRRSPALRCLLMSAERQRQDVQQLVDQGITAYLAKPFSKAQLVQKIAELPAARRDYGRRRILAAAALVMLALTAGWWLRAAPPPLPRPQEVTVSRGSAIEPRSPIGELQEAPTELAWRESEGAADYRLSLRAVDEQLLWQARVPGSPAVLPVAEQNLLLPGVTYFWQVEALDSDGDRLAWSQPVRFRLAAVPGAAE